MNDKPRFGTLWVVGIGVWLWLGVGGSTVLRAENWRLSVGSVPAGGEYPIIAEVPEKLTDGVYELRSSGGSSPTITAQVFSEGERRLIGFILPGSDTGAKRTFTLAPSPAGAVAAGVGIAFKAEGRNLAVNVDGKPLTVYRVDRGSKPFFFPLIGPTGDRYTRAFPMENVDGEDRDHPHQTSLWFTHGNVNGTDFWAETKTNGLIEETDRKVVVQGPVLGRLKTWDEWHTREGRKICDDERVVTFYRIAGLRVIDFDTVIKASVAPVGFGDTKEGMFGVRVASSMDVNKKQGGRITNAEGLVDDKAWGKASAWVDYVGPVNGKTVGVTILNHPLSFRYPTTWHVRTYGLFAANPFGWKDFGMKERGDYTMVPGQEMVFRYRVILHEGATDPGRIDAMQQVYGEAPAVIVEAE